MSSTLAFVCLACAKVSVNVKVWGLREVSLVLWFSSVVAVVRLRSGGRLLSCVSSEVKLVGSVLVRVSALERLCGFL